MEGSGEFPTQTVAADAQSLLKVFQRVIFSIVFLKIRFHGQQISRNGLHIPGDGQGGQHPALRTCRSVLGEAVSALQESG